MQKNAPKKYTKLKTTHRNCKNHTKNAKNDISGITDMLPGFTMLVIPDNQISPYRG
jgi:hypothetical protein